MFYLISKIYLNILIIHLSFFSYFLAVILIYQVIYIV